MNILVVLTKDEKAYSLLEKVFDIARKSNGEGFTLRTPFEMGSFSWTEKKHLKRFSVEIIQKY